jgi:hypothetical protein
MVLDLDQEKLKEREKGIKITETLREEEETGRDVVRVRLSGPLHVWCLRVEMWWINRSKRNTHG